MNSYTVEDVTAAALDALLTADPARWQWFYGEQKETTELLWWSAVLASPGGWQQWTHGRAFDAASELTWWRAANGGYRLRLLSDEAPPAVDGLNWGDANPWQPWGGPQKTLLHGQLDADRSAQTGAVTWSEARIPRYLAYPLQTDAASAPQRVLLETQPYAQNGVVSMTRLLRVIGDE